MKTAEGLDTGLNLLLLGLRHTCGSVLASEGGRRRQPRLSGSLPLYFIFPQMPSD